MNTFVGSMAAYGLAGMRNQVKAILINMVLCGLQSLISTQLQIFCVWLTPNQVRVLQLGYCVGCCVCIQQAAW